MKKEEKRSVKNEQIEDQLSFQIRLWMVQDSISGRRYVNLDGWYDEVKKRKEYSKPGVVRREAKKEAIRNARRNNRRNNY